jgi:TonB family protein
VCRATTGTEAPDLGVRLDTRTGLSGACVLTREVQHCNDTESDPRVNLEVSRRLGVRSVLVVPLLRDKELVGIFEIFSPEANHFGEPDISTIKSLANEVIQNLKKVSGSGAEEQIAEEQIKDAEVAPVPLPEVESSPAQQPILSVAGVEVEARSRANELWTIALSVMVIAAAIFLGVLVGWRLGWQKAAPRVSRRAKSASVKTAVPPSIAGSSAKEPQGGGTNQEQAKSAVLTYNAATPPEAGSVSGALKTETATAARSAAAVVAGGLVVYQNGKVIYRMAPTAPAPGVPPIQQPTRSSQVSREPAVTTSNDVQEVSEEAAAARLIHRVEPQYPAEARQQNVQGVVVLRAQIGKDGSVRDLTSIQGPPLLTKAAEQAVNQWQYEPYSVDGKTVEIQTRITIKFTLPTD